MLKKNPSVLICLLALLFIPFINPQTAHAETLISPIGDIPLGEKQSVTVSGLSPKVKYIWKEFKLTGTFPTKQLSEALSRCFEADDKREIVNNIGPISIPGIYYLHIYGTLPGKDCEPASNTLAFQEFSVGGKTGQDCCNKISNFPIYDAGKDICKNQVFTLFSSTDPTECTKAKPSTYCEPESLQCFQNKTPTVKEKVCLDPADPQTETLMTGNEKDKYTICTFAKGKECTTDPSNPGIATAIGCIHTNPAALTKDILRFLISIGGGLAFLMMLLGAFQMITSGGNPETLATGRSRLTSAVIGLLFVIFSILLLQIIGADILNIPGFK